MTEPVPLPDVRSALVAEISRIEESAKFSSQGQFEAAKMWRAWNWALGGFTAIASGVAGVLTFADGAALFVAGGLAVTAAVTAATHTTLKPDKKGDRAQVSGNRYLSLQSGARRLRNLEAPYTSDLSGLRISIEALGQEIGVANSAADVIPALAYRRAKKSIEQNGGQTYAADQQ